VVYYVSPTSFKRLGEIVLALVIERIGIHKNW